MEYYILKKYFLDSSIEFRLKKSYKRVCMFNLSLKKNISLNLKMRFIVSNFLDINILKGYLLLNFFLNGSYTNIKFGKILGTNKRFISLSGILNIESISLFFLFLQKIIFINVFSKGLFLNYNIKKIGYSLVLGDLGEYSIEDYGFDLYKWEPRLICSFSFDKLNSLEFNLIKLSYFNLFHEKILFRKG